MNTHKDSIPILIVGHLQHKKPLRYDIGRKFIESIEFSLDNFLNSAFTLSGCTKLVFYFLLYNHSSI